MAESLEYQEFQTLDEYAEFWRTFEAAKENSAMVYVPNPDTGYMTLAKTGMWHPYDDKDLVRILADLDLDYYIAPVFKTPGRLRNTYKHNYRFERSEEIVGRYRQEMARGDFFPLLAFDLVRDHFCSGEHRLLAGNTYDAHFCVVFRDLTDQQLVEIYERTNLYHSHGYSTDERANLFYDISKLPGVTPLQAYTRAGLTVRSTNGTVKATGTIQSGAKRFLLAGEMVRKYPAVLDTGGGRRRPMNTIGEICMHLGGKAAIQQLTEEEWLEAYALGSGIFTGPANQVMRPRQKALREADPRGKLRLYKAGKEEWDRKQALRKADVTSEEIDDAALVDIARFIVSKQATGLAKLRALLPEEDRKLLGRAAFLLDRTFGGDV